jgi:hypothetical protein
VSVQQLRRLPISLQAVPQLRKLVADFPLRRPEFEARSDHVEFVVDKVAWGQVFFCQFLINRLLHTHCHLSSKAGTIGQLVAEVPSGPSPTPPHEDKNIPVLFLVGEYYKLVLGNLPSDMLLKCCLCP